MPANPHFPRALLDRAKKIKLFLMDVDGTLTGGGGVCLISPPGGGEILEMKVFNAKDGAGLTLAHIMGIKTGFITGRKSPAAAARQRSSRGLRLSRPGHKDRSLRRMHAKGRSHRRRNGLHG